MCPLYSLEIVMHRWRFLLFVLVFISPLMSLRSYPQSFFGSAFAKLPTLNMPLLSTPLKSTFTLATPATGCGTDTNGNPTNNLTCGANGSSPYTGEGGASSLTSWCGGSVPGSCHAVTSCGEELTEGTWESHEKYYLPADLNCGTASIAIILTRYTDVNLNGHKVTGFVYSNAGPKGWHFFGGEVSCTMSKSPTSFLVHGVTHWTYACMEDSNLGGTYVQGGGDQIKLHHVYGQNGMACAKYIQFDGPLAAPSGGWSEPAIDVYNMTFQSVPVGTTCHREYAGVYSETQPVEYHHIRGDIGATGQANAAQMLVVYAPAANGSYPNYIHNNYLTCEPFDLLGGDSCRAILIDGARSGHVQYNDIWVSNNRGTRLRDALNAEVDHNYYHKIIGAAVHTGYNDIYSSTGQVLTQKIHNNTFELAGGSAFLYGDQQGLISESNKFLCYSGGCSGSFLIRLDNWASTFSGYPVGVSPSANTVTQPSGSFFLGSSIRPGSVVSLGGFSHSGNNSIFTVNTATTKTLTLNDPNNLLVSETSSSARHVGLAHAYLYNSTIGAGLTPKVEIHYDLVKPSAFLSYCNSGTLTKYGNGILLAVTGTCP